MVGQLGEKLASREKNIISHEGFFRVDNEKVRGVPLFYGSIFVDPICARIVYLETLPLVCTADKTSDMLFAVNAVNNKLRFGKFYLTPARIFEDGKVNRVIYENSLSCASGEITDDDTDFIIDESMSSLRKYSVGLLRIIDGSVTAEEFVNAI